jgi:co-chaperonin GroES (HSP10)
MKFKVARGFLAVTPLQEIPFGNPTKSEGVFGPKINEKNNPNELLYKFKVVAVGDPYPAEGQMVPAEVKVGDVVSLTSFNKTIRSDFEELGLVVDGVRYFIISFSHVAVIWTPESEEKSNA